MPKLKLTKSLFHPDKLAFCVNTKLFVCLGASTSRTVARIIQRIKCKKPATTSIHGIIQKTYMFSRAKTAR